MPSLPALAQQTDLFSGFGAKGKGPIEVDAKTLEILEEGEQRISIFSGGVTVRRGNTTMKAAQIKLFSKKESEATDQSGFTRMEATGTVYVNSGKQTITGSQAIVDNKAETITLSGNVVLSQGKDVLAADRLVIDMATGRATVEQVPGKSIRMVITPDVKKKKDGKGDEAGTAPATQ